MVFVRADKQSLALSILQKLVQRTRDQGGAARVSELPLCSIHSWDQGGRNADTNAFLLDLHPVRESKVLFNTVDRVFLHPAPEHRALITRPYPFIHGSLHLN
jgi:hypothetical protein